MSGRWKIRTSLSGILGAAMLLTAAPSWAETLADALVTAYNNSPTLKINQAALRAADEGVAQASAGRRPQVDLGATLQYRDATNSPIDHNEIFNTELTANLLLYDGGRTDAAVKSAKSSVAAARASLKSVEQSVLLNAITAYVDVRRDQRFVSLAENNVRVIGQQVEAARDRFDVGEVTRTDVSQADARLAAARSNLAANRGSFEASRQAYMLAIGVAPSNLAPPPALPALPASLERALGIAKAEHPAIRSAQYAAQAAEFDVVRARGAKKPTVALGAGVTYGGDAQSSNPDQVTGSVSLNGSMPIFDGGTNNSLIRQSLAVLDRRRAELQDSARSVERDAALAWSSLEVARASIRSSRQQIRAARIAFDGIQEEAKLGARTTLDVLDAEQEVLNAESGLTAALRDEYVAAYNLVAAMGLLTTDYLNLGIDAYDPNDYYQSVNKKPLTAEGAALNRINKRWNN